MDTRDLGLGARDGPGDDMGMGRGLAGQYDIVTTTLLAVLVWGIYASFRWAESPDWMVPTTLGCVAIGGVGAAAWGLLRLIEKWRSKSAPARRPSPTPRE